MEMTTRQQWHAAARCGVKYNCDRSSTFLRFFTRIDSRLKSKAQVCLIPFCAEAANAHDNCTDAECSDDDDCHDDDNCQHTTNRTAACST
jgi:hypothetical protein